MSGSRERVDILSSPQLIGAFNGIALMAHELRPARLELIARMYDSDERMVYESRIPNMKFPHVDAEPMTAAGRVP